MVPIANIGQIDSRRRLRTAILGTVLVVIAGTCNAAPEATDAVELRNGVVIDPGAGVVYLMNPGGGIDAVSLSFGTVLWHSDDAARPISTSGQSILAQVEVPDSGNLELAALNASGDLIRSVAVEIPREVKAPVVYGLSHRFLIRGGPTTDGQSFDVAWQSTYFAPRGALILDEASMPQVRTGAFAFDPASGDVTALEAPANPLAAPQIHVPESQRLEVDGHQYYSADGNHVLTSVPAVGSAADTYDWIIFDAGGVRHGSFTHRVAYAPFFVGDGLVVYESRPGARREGDRMVDEPLALNAVSLSSGDELWSVVIRDTEYRGPFPP